MEQWLSGKKLEINQENQKLVFGMFVQHVVSDLKHEFGVGIS